MATAPSQPHSGYLAIVVASQVSLTLLLSLPGTAISAVGQISRDIPFLDTDDPATICSNAVQYVSPMISRETYGASSLPQPQTVTLAIRPATDGTRSESQTAMSESSITISVNSSMYIPRQPLQVIISSPTPYRGFMLHARRVGQSTVVGRFVVSAPTTSPVSSTDSSATVSDNFRSVNCDSLEDTIYGWREVGYNESFTWIAPDEDLGQVQFVATVFQDVHRYWTNVTSSILRKGFIPIDLSSCGKTKGCFRYCSADDRFPCDSQTSIYALTYHVVDNTAHFEMTAAAEWVAVGFSSDEKMGGDDVFLCSGSRLGSGSVRTYFTDIGYVPPTLKAENTLSDAEFESTWTVSQRGTHLPRTSCRFTRTMKVMFDQQSVDLSNNWYQLYAWGSVSSSGDTINRHSLDKPPTSTHKLTLRNSRNDVISGTVAVTRPTVDGRSHLMAVGFMTSLLLWCSRKAC